MTNKPIYSFPSGPQTKQMAAAEAATRFRQAKKGSGGGSGSGSGNGDGDGRGGGGGWGDGGPPGTPADNGAIVGNPMYDLFSSAGSYLLHRQTPGQNYMTQYYIPEYNAIRYDLYFNDLSGGIDAQVRRIGEGPFTNELAASFLNATHSRTLILPPLITSDSGSTNSIGTIEAMSACYLNDAGTPRWVVAAGDTANKALFTLGASGVTAQTYTPGSNIISLTATKIATVTERVIVGRAGAAAQVLTGIDGSPTVDATMNALTAALWGCIPVPLNSTAPGYETLLMYAGGSGATLYSLSASAATGDAPTAVLTGWPSGGYALGIANPSEDDVPRACWVHPLNTSATSMLDSGLPGRIVSTNLEGTDFKVHEIPGMPFVKHAMRWRGGIVATDGRQVVWLYRGVPLNLGWNRERRWDRGGIGVVASSFGFGVLQAIAVVGDRLLVSSATITADTQDVASPTFWEEYIPEENKWQFFVRNDSLHDSLLLSVSSSVLPNVALFTGETPWYAPHDTGVDSGRFFWYTKAGDNAGNFTFKWQNVPLVASGINPNYQQSESAWISYAYDDDSLHSENFCITPEYHFMGFPMVVSDIQFMGTMKGEDAVVRIRVGLPTSSGTKLTPGTDEVIPTALFTEDTDWRRYWWFNPISEDTIMDRLQLRISINRGTSGSNVSKATPNALPFRVGGYFFPSGQYTSPKTIEPKRYWGPPEL